MQLSCTQMLLIPVQTELKSKVCTISFETFKSCLFVSVERPVVFPLTSAATSVSLTAIQRAASTIWCPSMKYFNCHSHVCHTYKIPVSNFRFEKRKKKSVCVLLFLCCDSYLSFWLCEGFCSSKLSVAVRGQVPICLSVSILISSGGSCLSVEACN